MASVKGTQRNPTNTHATTTNDTALTLITLAPLVPSAVLPTNGFVVDDVVPVVDVPLAATELGPLVLVGMLTDEVEFA